MGSSGTAKHVQAQARSGIGRRGCRAYVAAASEQGDYPARHCKLDNLPMSLPVTPRLDRVRVLLYLCLGAATHSDYQAVLNLASACDENLLQRRLPTRCLLLPSRPLSTSATSSAAISSLPPLRLDNCQAPLAQTVLPRHCA